MVVFNPLYVVVEPIVLTLTVCGTGFVADEIDAKLLIGEELTSTVVDGPPRLLIDWNDELIGIYDIYF